MPRHRFKKILAQPFDCLSGYNSQLGGLGGQQSVNGLVTFKQAADFAAFVNDGIDDVGKFQFADVGGEKAHRLGGRAVGTIADFFDQAVFDFFNRFFGTAVVHNFEMRRNAGFERETFQNFLTKTVDGLNFNTAGGVKQNRKQTSCPGFQFVEPLRILRQHAVKFSQLIFKTAVVGNRPAAEFLRNAGVHFHRGCLGIGEA